MHFKYIVFYILIFDVNGQHDSQHMFFECNLISEFINYKVMIIRYFYCYRHKLLRCINFSRKIIFSSRKNVINLHLFVARCLTHKRVCLFEVRWFLIWCWPERRVKLKIMRLSWRLKVLWHLRVSLGIKLNLRQENYENFIIIILESFPASNAFWLLIFFMLL
jgi:hypothetical protein